ncbi:MAG: DUF2520 domain-containing protein [Planctomycetota bacterium]
MPTSFAVIGPGKVGQALARRWREAGYHLLGFLGRTTAAAERAAAFAGGEALTEPSRLRAATFVLVAVPDARIAEAAAAAAEAGAVRPCSLWLHASGATSLDVLAPLAAAGSRVGSLHPLCPFASADDGYVALPGRAAALSGDARSLRLLRVLAAAAGMHPVELGEADRGLYHAACALAANGATVLHALATRWFASAAPGASRSAADLTESLVAGALQAAMRLGAEEALTGPAARGDVVTLRRHLQAIAAHGVAGAEPYRALMRAAARMAHARGDLDDAALARVVDTLASPGRG